MAITKALLAKIEECYSQDDKVVVFTQDTGLIASFLDNVPGRWRVAVDEAYWSIDQLLTKHGCRGPLTNGIKYSINPESAERCEIGIDVCQPETKIVFSKTPYRIFPGAKSYIMDDFSMPDVHIGQALPPLMAMQKFGRSTCFFADSSEEFSTLHDHLIIQDIKHTLDPDVNDGSVGIFKAPRFVRGYDNAVVYGYSALKKLFALDSFKDVHVIVPEALMECCDFKTCDSVIRALHDGGGMAYSEEFISYMTGVHQRNVARVMQFLLFHGYAAVGTADAHMVMIQKVGDQPKDDPLFSLIPQGQYTVAELVNIIRVERTQVMAVLKRYEKAGLVFSYRQSANSKVYSFVKRLTREDHDVLMARFALIIDFLLSLRDEGNAYLRQSLENLMIEICRANKAKSFIFRNGKFFTEISLPG